MQPMSKTLKEIDEEKEKEDLRKLEAVLFVAGKFLNMQELISLTDLNPILIRELIEKLKKRYQDEESAIEIVEKGEDSSKLYKMDVKNEYSFIATRLAGGSSEFSRAEQRTLAMIAYKQPVKQSVIIKIRGNKAYEHIKKFIELGLLKKKKLGRTNELSLSDEFYDYFNVDENSKGGDLLNQEAEEIR